MERGSVAPGSPWSSRIWPASALNSPSSTRTVVDFPAPFGPKAVYLAGLDLQVERVEGVSLAEPLVQSGHRDDGGHTWKGTPVFTKL